EAGAKVLPTAAETGSGAEAMETVTAGAGIGVAAGAAYASAGLAPNVAEAAAGGLADAEVDPRSFAAVAFPLEPGTPLPKPEPVFPKFVRSRSNGLARRRNLSTGARTARLPLRRHPHPPRHLHRSAAAVGCRRAGARGSAR